MEILTIKTKEENKKENKVVEKKYEFSVLGVLVLTILLGGIRISIKS